MIVFTEKELKDIVKHIKGWTGIVLSEEQAKMFLEEEDDLAMDIKEHTIFDTMARESFMSRLSMKLIGMDWPTGGDINDGKMNEDEFFQKLRTGAVIAGYRIED